MSAQKPAITLELLAQMGFKIFNGPMTASLEIVEEDEALFLRMTSSFDKEFNSSWELEVIFSSSSLKGNVHIRNITPSLELLEAIVSNHANFFKRMRRSLEAVQID